jgi:hypothetical protein
VDALIGVAGGIAGVLIGWGLGYLQQQQQQKRAGRAAALLLMDELLHNEGRLKELHELTSVVRDQPVRRQVWDVHGVALYAVASHEDLLALVKAYHVADSTESTSKSLRDALEHEYEAIRELQDRLSAAKSEGDDEQQSQVAEDIRRRAGENVPLLKAARDDFLGRIKTEQLPAVSHARERVARLTGIR